MRNFEVVVDNLIGQVEPQEVSILPESRDIAIRGLEEKERRYGEESEHHMAYHNVGHDIDVTSRDIRLTNLLYRFVPEEYREGLYDKIIVKDPWHDWERLLSGPGANERASADRVIEEIENSGSPVLNTERFKTSIDLGIMATQMERVDGDFVQVNLRTGEPDPSILLGAWADIGGVPMEGIKRAKLDAVDLCHEDHPDPSLRQLLDYFLIQPDFFKNVVDDATVLPNIEYYFPQNAEEVYGVLRKAFHSNIVTTYKTLMFIRNHPEVETAMLRGAGLLDRMHVGSAIGGLISKAAKL
ncbi:MAG TPA: hypothetical protein VFK11_00610 [Candidatus Saccharimonadales bacterium]|nr:hypothetical protein [Candidatus Saccharimonadales bacterium]